MIFDSKLATFEVANVSKERDEVGMGKTMSLKTRIEELKATARELGGELLVEESDFHDKNHLNCLWYDSGQLVDLVLHRERARNAYSFENGADIQDSGIGYMLRLCIY